MFSVLPVTTQDEEETDSTTSSSALEYLLSRDQDYVPEQPTVEADIDPEQDDRFTEYYTSRQEPVPEGVVPFDEPH